MARIRNVEMADKILVTLEVSKDELKALDSTHSILLLSAASLDDTLTTGSIGNGNRIMIPNKLLKKNSVQVLGKHLPFKVVELQASKYLVIELEKNSVGIPVFGGMV